MSADRSVIKYLLKTELNMKDEQRHALLESKISLFFWSHGGYGGWVWSTFWLFPITQSRYFLSGV